MPDDMDLLQDFNDQHNQDALDANALKMADMEMVEGEYACEDCGKVLYSLTKARAAAPMILCGSCSDWHKQRNKLGKMRDGYP